MWPLLETNFASGTCVTGVDRLANDHRGVPGAYGNKGPECLHPGTWVQARPWVFWLNVDPLACAGLPVSAPCPVPCAPIALCPRLPRLFESSSLAFALASTKGLRLGGEGSLGEVSSSWPVHLIAKGEAADARPRGLETITAYHDASWEKVGEALC